jgi:hypothetical protein
MRWLPPAFAPLDRLKPTQHVPARAPSRRLLVDLVIVLAIALVGVVTWKLQPRADLTLAVPACDLNLQTCIVDLPQGARLELGVEPRPIPTLRPIMLDMRLSGIEPEKVEVDFAGVRMNMGFNRPELTAAGQGRYAGQATLPVCVTGAMEWQATALLHTAAGTVSVPFRFEAGRH